MSKSDVTRVLKGFCVLIGIVLPLIVWVVHNRAEHEKLNYQMIGAVLDGDPRSVKDYLAQGADANERLPEANHRRGYTEYGKQMLRVGRRSEGRGISALMAAALIRDVPTMRILLDAGANPNALDEDGYTPILWAASRQALGSAPAIQLLTERGADVKVKANDGTTAWRLVGRDPAALRALNAAAGLHIK